MEQMPQVLQSIIIFSCLIGLCCTSYFIYAFVKYLLLIPNNGKKWVKSYNAMNGKWFWREIPVDADSENDEVK